MAREPGRPVIVVGIDPSLTSTGVARIAVGDGGHAVVTLDRVTSTGKADATLADRTSRLARAAYSVAYLAVGADLVVIEAPAYSRNLPGAHDRHGLWWLIVRELHAQARVTGGHVVEVPPNLRAKYATGKGNAGKDEVLLAVARRWAHVATPDGNDQADALVLATIGADHLGRPLVDLPQGHRDALVKVAWPA